MNKCEIVKDLLPLYIDEVCSAESSKFVATHMNECDGCRKLYDSMKQPAFAEDSKYKEKFEEQQAKALKKVGKKNKTIKIVLLIVGIVVGVCILSFTAIILAALGIFGFEFMTSKVAVHTDVENYSTYIDYGGSDFENFVQNEARLFPSEITSDMSVKDFQYTYYNPWDPQYIAYLTVEYNDEDYEAEINRLNAIGIEDYEGYYSVTSEPDGFDLIAMDSDEYNGFTYVMVPEGDNSSNSITYVAIWFCNYFLDIDVHDYIPDEYLLEGFDASKNNPYREECMN